MPTSPSIATPFSATVTLAMLIDGRTYELAEVSSFEAVLRNAEPVRNGPATVIVTIDGQSTTSQVRIAGQAGDGRTLSLSS